VTLCTDLHLPEGDGPWPCLLQRVPYDKGAPAIPNGTLDVARWVRRGYAVARRCQVRRAASGRDGVEEDRPKVSVSEQPADDLGLTLRQ
jgi:hypothetical protein